MPKKKSSKKVSAPAEAPSKPVRKKAAKQARRGKNIIVCLDGTGNLFGEHNSNVVKLFRSITRGTREQVAYYDAGVGTLAAPDFKTPAGKKIDKVFGLAFGTGLSKDIGDAYRYLMAHYQTGDRVFLFGFSRGAYTARALAGLVHCCGLLEPGLDNLVPYALKLFSAAQKLDFQVIARFKSTYARKGAVDIHFLGLWDTVSSYG
ncbi:MAG: T6SS phospholipase effector Tle1-like catalytic domain-containing protein, partial [Verrucomicrobiales bacterium]